MLGAELGSKEGILVGLREGMAESEGSWLGIEEGPEDGWKLGLNEGDKEGK